MTIENLHTLLVYNHEIFDWLEANKIEYHVFPHWICTKKVFQPTEDNQNEYDHDGWEIMLDKNDAIRLKLSKGGEYFIKDLVTL